MVRSPWTPVNVLASLRRAGPLCAAALVLAGAVVLTIILLRPAVATAACDRSATPSTLASQISAASSGQTICLASGAYGTWSGTNKQVTLRAAEHARPAMRVDLGPGDSGFTLD